MAVQNQRAEDIFRVAILTLMVGCVALSPVAAGQRLVSGWNGTYLVLFCMAVAIEAYCSYRLLNRPGFDGSDRTRARLFELAAIFVLLQVCNDIADGRALFENNVPQFSWKTAEIFVPVFIVWASVGGIAEALAALSRPLFEGPQGIPPERRLAARVFGGGIFLFLISAISQPRIAGALKMPGGDSAGPVVNVLFYFLLGIVLLGHVHYATLRQRWQSQKVTIAGGFGRRWLQYSLAFLALVAFIALVFPTNHTAGLLDPWRQAWNEMLSLLRGPLTWLLQLFGKTSQVTKPPQLPPITPPPNFHPPRHLPHHGNPAGGINWGALAQSFFFWAVVLAAVVYMVRSYWQHRRPFFAWRPPGKLGQILGALSRLWTSLRRWIRGGLDSLGDYMPRVHALRPAPSVPATGLRRLIRLGALSPREQVMRYYLSTVRRAGRRGFHRQPSQTPHEYDETLAPHLAEAEVDMHSLTDAFVEARYSQHGVEDERVGIVRGSWKRVRDALRKA